MELKVFKSWLFEHDKFWNLRTLRTGVLLESVLKNIWNLLLNLWPSRNVERSWTPYDLCEIYCRSWPSENSFFSSFKSCRCQKVFKLKRKLKKFWNSRVLNSKSCQNLKSLEFQTSKIYQVQKSLKFQNFLISKSSWELLEDKSFLNFKNFWSLRSLKLKSFDNFWKFSAFRNRKVLEFDHLRDSGTVSENKLSLATRLMMWKHVIQTVFKILLNNSKEITVFQL